MLKRFLLLNGLATIGVVMNHAAGKGYTALFWWTDKYMPGATVPDFSQAGSLSYYGLRTIEQLIAFSISAFLVVSGFFIAFSARQKSGVSWNTVKTRLWYLIIPYLLWSIAIFARDYIVYDELYTPLQYGRRLLEGGVISGYYYVPMLCQLFLLAPFLVKAARRSWRMVIIVALIIHIFIQMILFLDSLGVFVPRWLMFWTSSWLFPNNLIWFTLGIVVSFNLKPFKAWLATTKKWWLLTAVVLIPIGIIEWEIIQNLSGQPFLPTRLTLIDSLYAAAVIFAILGYETITLPREHELNDLGTKSFGIYLANSPVLDTVVGLVLLVIPALLAYQILYQPLLWAAGLGIPLLLMTAVAFKKSPIRSYYQYFFG